MVDHAEFPGGRRRGARGMRVAAAATVCGAAALSLASTGPSRAVAAVTASAKTPTSCTLVGPTGPVSHVINLVFDNVHFTRDNPDVPSDLEQMPNLLNFMEQNGVLLSNMHTPLIAHTADDILTTLTGVYGDKHGQPVSNSYGVFNTTGTASFASSFAYWTDPVANSHTTDTTPTMVAPNGGQAPAPWVPFTRAGCDVGAFSTANLEVENADPDIKAIYGAGSSQWAAVLADEKAHFGFADISNADYQGIAVHCAQTATSVCSQNPSLAAPDLLPNEPGAYTGYQALYGNKNVGPAVGGTVVAGQGVRVDDLNGQPMTNYYASQDTGAPYYGFPGFSNAPAQTLAYVADMQEHGIPVTYGYIEDAHQNLATDSAAGPGDAAYVQNLKDFDASFGQFFQRLAADGITTKNTLFEIGSDEGDHFAGTQHPTPTGCNGVTTACTYAQGQIGEVTVGLTGLLAAQTGDTANDWSIHFDSAPNFYIRNNPAAGSARERTLEREVTSLTAPDPYANNDTGGTVPLTKAVADQVEETVLHFKTGDPNRLPSFTDFANPDFYVQSFINKTRTATANCNPAYSYQTATSDPCVIVDPTYAWNHGDVAPEINTNWAGFVGPGVTARGVDRTTWADETDIRPTMMSLVGLTDDYVHDGRVLLEDVTPKAVHGGQGAADVLGFFYKQMDADVGVFASATLAASTAAIESNTTNDAKYTSIETSIASLGSARDALAATIQNGLDQYEFHGGTLSSSDVQSWSAQAVSLMVQAIQLAAGA